MATAIPPEVLGFGLLIIGGMILGGLALFFRQPLILAYILVGVLLGSQGLGIIGPESQELLSHISSELGIAFLLFVVGLELSFKKILEVKNVVMFGTIATTIVLFIAGMFAGYFMGFPFMTGVYIGLILAFSSTLLVVKMLGEKAQVDTLSGRIMIGTLVFQDIIVILAVSILSIIAGAEPTEFLSWVIGLIFMIIGSIGSLAHVPLADLEPWVRNIAMLVGALLLFLIAYLLNRFVARYLFRYFSRSAEMLFVSALGFFFILSFAAAEFGFSISIGAFLSGIIVANTDHYLDVLNRIKTLAVFFSVLFFATLGFQLSFEKFSALIVPIVVICALTLVLKPIITGFIIAMFGYDKRTAILSGLHMSQISEFSLILVAVGINQGQLSAEFLTITVISLLVTMTISTYYMKYGMGMIGFLQKLFPSLAADETVSHKESIENATVVVYGVEHIDEQLLENIRKAHEHILVIDPDPSSVQYLRNKGIPALLGSLGNEELLEKLHFHKTKVLVSTVPDFEENMFVAKHLRQHHPHTVIVMPARKVKEALALYNQGVNYVLITSFIDDSTVQGLLFNLERVNLDELKKKHMDRLVLIANRNKGAMDIDDFMAVLAEQPFEVGKTVFKTTARSFEEVDKFVKNIGRKKR